MFTLKISTASAAFDDLEAELMRILRDVAKRIARGQRSAPVQDHNGNTVGSFSLQDD